ncbi:MAG: type II restriction endonuclease [bacterium]
MKFNEEFYRLVEELNITYEIRGLLSSDDRIYPFSTDTKVLSTVFELFCIPLVKQIATKYSYKVQEAPQTIYPDFTLLKYEEDKNKIAIDVKTTYRRGQYKSRKGEKPWIFTLGSYTSFLRNDTKNILYPYYDYKEHWIIGFVYTRVFPVHPKSFYSLNERNQIECPFKDVEIFVQEKYKIAGLKPGSGNTTNIGSIASSQIADFRQGNGPFAKYGEDVFRDYWANYHPNRSKRKYTNLEEYFKWKKSRRNK